MKTTQLLLLPILLTRVSSQCLSEDDALAPPPHPSLSQVAPFSLDLFGKVLPPSGNFLFSPFSVWSALVLAYFGSRGDTKAQMERVLRLPAKEETLALYRALKQIYAPSADGQKHTMLSSNRIYIDTSLPVRRCVQQVLPDEVKTLNFAQPDLAAATINHFVNASTQGKIPRLVTTADVTLARLAFVNAVYFKGFWETPFAAENTRREEFFLSPKRRAYVDMMEQTDNFKNGASEELDADVVELPYRGGAASMVVLLPRDRGTGGELDRMLQRLTPAALASAVGNLARNKVLLKFPKFKLESSLRNELIEALTHLGLRDLFSPAADLTAFSPSGGLMITHAVHKAVIEVDEKGTEAAAATVFLSKQSGTYFTCNRPFLFFIRDNAVNSILFLGVYREP
nr:leukocyte elastase inhibitor-like [Penaeus vannamei]